MTGWMVQRDNCPPLPEAFPCLILLRMEIKMAANTTMPNNDVFSKRYATPMRGKRAYLTITGAGGCISNKSAMDGLNE